MSILRGLHIVLWIIAFTAAAAAYDWHLRQVSDHVAEAQDLAQKLTDTEELYHAAIHPDPVTNPDPMSATVKLSIEGGGHGSGTHIGGGYIITAGHVALKEGAELTARFEDGTEREAVTLWSSHFYDVALLRIDEHDGIPASNLECRAPERQEHIWIYGNPQFREFNVTEGTVTGKVHSGDCGGEFGWREIVPVDAASGPGMSGGGVFDSDNDLVGILVGTFHAMTRGPMGADRTTIGINQIVPASTICKLLARS